MKEHTRQFAFTVIGGTDVTVFKKAFTISKEIWGHRELSAVTQGAFGIDIQNT